MPRYGPGPVYLGRDQVNPRRNKPKAKRQGVKRRKWGKGGDRPAHRGGSGGWLFGGGKSKPKKTGGWFW